MIARSSFLALTAAATAAPLSTDPPDSSIEHVAIFRFPAEHLADAVDAFGRLEAASRRHPGNLAYTVYRSTDDPATFFIFERWASADALAAHERTDVFVTYGRGVLGRYATLHDTATGRPLTSLPQIHRRKTL